MAFAVRRALLVFLGVCIVGAALAGALDETFDAVKRDDVQSASRLFARGNPHMSPAECAAQWQFLARDRRPGRQ